MGYFSLSFAFNYFSLTGLMVVAGLSGHPSLAADIGMLHSVTTVLFLGLSANARNVILRSSGGKSGLFFLMRSALILPVSLVALFVCGRFHGVSYLIAGLLTLRRAGEWLVEISLSEKEAGQERRYAKGYFLTQTCLFFLVASSLALGGGRIFELSAALWAVSPLLWVRLERTRFSCNLSELRDLSPHIGSTLIVGIGLYMFRGMLILLVGKEFAGDLFSAFALGGVIPSLYGNVVGPGIESESKRGHHGRARLMKHSTLKLVSGGMLLGGAALGAWVGSPLFFPLLGKSGLFWAAVGLSVLGGAVMLLVQVERTALLQSRAAGDVFAPDLLMNLVIIASVPYTYYLFGLHSLTALFLWNSCVGWLFYKSYSAMIGRESGGVSAIYMDERGRRIAKYVIAVLVVLPVFFQIGHGLFIDRSLIFESGGVVKDLPLPISVIACVAGILLLGNYRQAAGTLYLVFALFFLMALSAAVSAEGDMLALKSKVILMLQYLIPWSGLVLGQMFVERRDDVKIVQRAFLGVVLCIVLPQLIISYVNRTPGDLRLRSYMYIFSIYQHFQYAPIVLCGAYLIALFGLYRRNQVLVLTLSAAIGLYALVSTSRMAAILVAVGVASFLMLGLRDRLRWIHLALVFATVFWMLSVFDVPLITGKYAPLFGRQWRGDINIEQALAGPPRWHYWDYYFEGMRRGNRRNLLFGQQRIPDRVAHPSAHNYYIDYLYNFGVIPFLPFLLFIAFSAAVLWRRRKGVISSPSLTGLCLVLLSLWLDNFVKVGLRQPYPGIFSFFVWGILLKLSGEASPNPAADRAIAAIPALKVQ